MDLTLYQFRHRKKKKKDFRGGGGGVTFKDDDCEGLHSLTMTILYSREGK